LLFRQGKVYRNEIEQQNPLNNFYAIFSNVLLLGQASGQELNVIDSDKTQNDPTFDIDKVPITESRFSKMKRICKNVSSKSEVTESDVVTDECKEYFKKFSEHIKKRCVKPQDANEDSESAKIRDLNCKRLKSPK
jgi:hypothetical protein